MLRKPWVRWFLVYPLLIVGGLHTLLTGSPIPLWHLESLDSPVQVKEITEEHLILADGRTVRLPFIRRLPASDPHFVVPVSQGVEVSDSGDVYVLMWVDRICGNDPYRWVRMRVNLSELAAAIDPTGIDDTRVDPESIAFLVDRWTESKAYPDRRIPGRTSYYQMGRLMNQARRMFSPGEGRVTELQSDLSFWSFRNQNCRSPHSGSTPRPHPCRPVYRVQGMTPTGVMAARVT